MRSTSTLHSAASALVTKPGPVVVGRVLACVAPAVEEDDERLRLLAFRLEEPDLVRAGADAALGHAVLGLGVAAATGEQAGDEERRQVSSAKHS